MYLTEVGDSCVGYTYKPMIQQLREDSLTSENVVYGGKYNSYIQEQKKSLKIIDLTVKIDNGCINNAHNLDTFKRQTVIIKYLVMTILYHFSSNNVLIRLNQSKILHQINAKKTFTNIKFSSLVSNQLKKSHYRMAA